MYRLIVASAILIGLGTCFVPRLVEAQNVTKSQIDAIGTFNNDNGCTYLDSGVAGYVGPHALYLSKHMDSTRDLGFAESGSGVILTMAKSGKTDEISGELFVVGQVRQTTQTTVVLYWKNCKGEDESYTVNISPQSKLCRNGAPIAFDALEPSQVILVQVKTQDAAHGLLIKGVLGSRAIRFLPFFQLHFVNVGQDFDTEKLQTCSQ